MLGVGVMIAELSGNEGSVKAFASCIGKKIKRVWLEEDALKFTFEDGTNLELFDDGQSCCESRYMRTDDNLDDYAGAELVSAQTVTGPDVPGEYDAHETEFLEVYTSKGSFKMVSHVEHNGYYGGFAITARLVP
jgi:hypothetical protein